MRLAFFAALALPAVLLAGAAPRSGSPPPSAVAADTARVHLASGTDAFVAWPSVRGTAPAVIIAHEWWGLNAQIRGVARRLAREGYVVIVPDLYHGRVAEDPEYAHELSRALDESAAQKDLAAAATWLRGEPLVGSRPIGVLGFCMGGALALEYGIRGHESAAVVVFYGEPETDPAKLASLKAPLQGHFGERDPGIEVARVDAFRAALQKSGRRSEIFEYAGAGHAFFNETRPKSFHADAARQAWARTLAFFQKHLRSET